MHQRLVSLAIFAVALLCTASASAGTFSSSYTAGYSTYTIKGSEPASGKSPVFIYTVGTSEQFDNGMAMAAVAEMAAKGFVAATVQYDSWLFGSCSQILAKAAAIFNGGSSASAVSKLCARSTADCSKGIVVAGFSQGAIIATNARNYDSRVRAAYGMGAHVAYKSYAGNYSVATCMTSGSYTLAPSNLRIVNGESDGFSGGSAGGVRSSSQSVTGKSCGSQAYECLGTNGSGWIMIRNSAVSDGSADHCYQRGTGGCYGSQSTLDSAWRNGSANWGLKANLSWLNGFATH